MLGKYCGAGGGGLSVCIDGQRRQNSGAAGMQYFGGAVKRHIGQCALPGGTVEQLTECVYLFVVLQQLSRRAAAHNRGA